MPIATPEVYAEMLARAKANSFAFPAINCTSSETINAAIKGFADAGSDGIIQFSTGGAEFGSGLGVKNMVAGAVALAEFAHSIAAHYDITIALHTDHPVINQKWLRLCAALAIRYGLPEDEALKAVAEVLLAGVIVDNRQHHQQTAHAGHFLPEQLRAGQQRGRGEDAALGMERLRHAGRLFGEATLTLFLSGGLALALIIFSLSRGSNVNIFSYLFGSIATVSANDLYLMAGCGIIICALIYLLFKRFFIVAYDEELSQANGLPIKLLNFTLMILAAVTISISMRIVGALLVGALMVIPVLAATQFGKSFKTTFVYSLGVSVLAVTTGLFASFYLNLPSGAAIVLTSLLLFALSLVLNKKS